MVPEQLINVHTLPLQDIKRILKNVLNKIQLLVRNIPLKNTCFNQLACRFIFNTGPLFNILHTNESFGCIGQKYLPQNRVMTN